jgi:hypothetical protein
MHDLELTGPIEHVDTVIDTLLAAGYDVLTRAWGVIARGECPHSAVHAVREFGWMLQGSAEPSSTEQSEAGTMLAAA